MVDAPRRKTRFAPSPTGLLHLGHARTHLVTVLRARRIGATIAMRIEDLDGPRVRPGGVDSILRTHEFLGFEFDEGPTFQSTRTGAYAAALERLRTFTFPCTCSRREIESLASAPHGEEGPVYPGTCRGRPSHPGRPAAVRFRLDAPPEFDDVLHGHVSAIGSGDFVLRRADGVFAYQLAVVVDDDAIGVTDVVRGDDLLASTPKQIALLRALGRPVPTYLHVPLVRAHDGERLAKRTGARAVLDFRDAGVGRETILGALGYSLGLIDEPRAATIAELHARYAGREIVVRDVDLESLLAASSFG